MKPKIKRIMITFGTYLVILCSFMNSSAIADEIPESYQPRLIYNVVEWEDNSDLYQGVSWILYNSTYNGTLDKGLASTNTGGKISVNITGYYEKNETYEYNEILEYVPYGDISFFKKEGTEFLLNLTLVNISMNEMGYFLSLGYMNWNPAFLISTDWEQNEIIALNLSYVEFDWGIIEADVSILNKKATITYIFKQIGGLEQSTTLKYDKYTGILLEAITRVGNYRCHIILQGDTINTNLFPGNIIFIAIFTPIVFGIVIFLIIKKKRTLKQK